MGIAGHIQREAEAWGREAANQCNADQVKDPEYAEYGDGDWGCDSALADLIARHEVRKHGPSGGERDFAQFCFGYGYAERIKERNAP